jgi:hypothetical protein
MTPQRRRVSKSKTPVEQLILPPEFFYARTFAIARRSLDPNVIKLRE